MIKLGRQSVRISRQLRRLGVETVPREVYSALRCLFGNQDSALVFANSLMCDLCRSWLYSDRVQMLIGAIDGMAQSQKERQS